MRTGAASAIGARRHNENATIMRTGAASAVGTTRHNENDVTMTIAGKLWHLHPHLKALADIRKGTWTAKLCSKKSSNP